MRNKVIVFLVITITTRQILVVDNTALDNYEFDEPNLQPSEERLNVQPTLDRTHDIGPRQQPIVDRRYTGPSHSHDVAPQKSTTISYDLVPVFTTWQHLSCVTSGLSLFGFARSGGSRSRRGLLRSWSITHSVIFYRGKVSEIIFRDSIVNVKNNFDLFYNQARYCINRNIFVWIF